MSVRNPDEEELQQLVFRFAETNRESPFDRLPVIPPISLTDAQIATLMASLGEIKNPALEEHIRGEIIEAAKYFPDALMIQELPAHSHLKRRFEGIQSTAESLRKQICKFPTPLIRSSMYAFLIQGIDEYAREISQAPHYRELAIPWNFWKAYRLPSALQSIELMDVWASCAIKVLERAIERDKLDSKQRGHKGQRKNIGKSATRTLVLKFALIWSNAKGQLPVARPGSRPKTRVTGFIPFAVRFAKAMRESITEEHRRYLPTITRELNLNAEAIQTRLGNIKARLKWQHERKAARNPKKSPIPRTIRLLK